jgi:hypothetical protein
MFRKLKIKLKVHICDGALKYGVREVCYLPLGAVEL